MLDPLAFWAAVSELGNPYLWSVLNVLLIVLYLPIARYGKAPRFRDAYRSFLLVLVVSLLASFAAVEAMKQACAIPRPCTTCAENPAACNPYCKPDSSFPSGHAATAFAAFTSLFLFKRKKRPAPLLFLVPLLIAISRVALGVHTYADIATGSFIGIALPLLVYHVSKRHGFVTYIK